MAAMSNAAGAAECSLFLQRGGGNRPRDRARDRRRTQAPAGKDRADRVGEHRLEARCSKRRVRFLPTNMPRVIPGGAITAAVNMSTSPRNWRSTGRSGCSTAAFANVQPHSGAQANQAVFFALMQPGDTFMGLSLDAGGHLTHGSPVNQSGKWFKPVPYSVRRQDHRIDMDEVEALAKAHKPKLIHRWRFGLCARDRFPPLPRDRRFRRRLFHGRHGAFRGARRGRRASQSARACPCRHHDDAQDFARPARRHDPVARCRTRKEDQLRRVPRIAGRPADACDRGEGGRVRRSAEARFQALCPLGGRERQGACRDACMPKASTSYRAARTRM